MMDFKQLLQNRRSVRAYSHGVISKEQVEEMVSAAKMAPSWKNSETARYYFAITPEKVKQVREECLPEFNQKSTAEASGYLVTTFVKNISGHKDGQPANELGNHWGAYDLGLSNGYLLLAAANMGIDTLIMGLCDNKRLREIFEIPEEEELVAIIALGYRRGEVFFNPRKENQDITKII